MNTLWWPKYRGFVVKALVMGILAAASVLELPGGVGALIAAAGSDPWEEQCLEQFGYCRPCSGSWEGYYGLFNGCRNDGSCRYEFGSSNCPPE